MRVGDGGARDGRIAMDPSPRVEKNAPGRLTQPVDPTQESAIEAPSPFARILQGLGREVDRGESIVRRAVTGAGRGQELDNLQLLALQAGVYRYSEAVDLSAKLVDRAASGVKTVIQGQ